MRLCLLFGLGALCVMACAHATTTAAEPAGPVKDGPGAAPSSTAKTGSRSAVPKVPEDLSTSKTTKQMFKPEGLKKLQRTLNERLEKINAANQSQDTHAAARPQPANPGEAAQQEKKRAQKTPLEPPDEVRATGDLDGPTQEALRAFQHSQQLPETGLPDYETLRRLGMAPADLMQHEPPSERVGVQ